MAQEPPNFEHGLNIGDRVQIMGDEKKVKQYQVDHGGWVDAMAGTIGQKGKIARLYQDGDVRVEVNGSSWTYNPQCLRVLERATPSSQDKSPHSTSYQPRQPSLSSKSFSYSPSKTSKPEPPKAPPRPVPKLTTSVDSTEKPSCSVCFEDFDGGDHRLIVFVPCGHTACKQCTNRMSQCHNCRKVIATKMPVYM